MATDNPTANPSPESESDDGFGMLQHRLFSAIQRMKLAVDKFSDYKEVPEDQIPAVFVVEEATLALAKIHDDYDAWHIQHIVRPKYEEAHGRPSGPPSSP